MGVFHSKNGSSSDGEPVALTAPSPETICSKQDKKMWQLIIDGLERRISEGTDEYPRENLQACLEWVKEYGYPIPRHEIWAFDGIATCQRKEDTAKFRNTKPGFFERRHECYAIVSRAIPFQ